MSTDWQALREQDVDPDPLRQFAAWYREASDSGLQLPEAATLATASADGAPSARMVLVKDVGALGFVFYSNYESRKGGELAANPRAALLFYWQELGRQVRVEGAVERLGGEDSAAYARSRPRGSQLSALASPQSQVIESRSELERRVASLEESHRGRELPPAKNWGGFRLTAERVEFWQQRRDRLHDRLLYLPDRDGWRVERLAP